MELELSYWVTNLERQISLSFSRDSKKWKGVSGYKWSNREIEKTENGSSNYGTGNKNKKGLGWNNMKESE